MRIQPELPDDVVGLIERALEKDAKLRYQSAKDLLADLRRLKRDSLTGVSIPRHEVEARPKKRLGSALWIVVALVVLALAVVPGFTIGPRPIRLRRLPQNPCGPDRLPQTASLNIVPGFPRTVNT